MSLTFLKSRIHGQGLFTVNPIQENKIITKVIEQDQSITKEGSMINHSSQPSARIILDYRDNCYYIVSNGYIPSYTELTCDYNQSPSFIAKARNGWK